MRKWTLPNYLSVQVTPGWEDCTRTSWQPWPVVWTVTPSGPSPTSDTTLLGLLSCLQVDLRTSMTSCVLVCGFYEGLRRISNRSILMLLMLAKTTTTKKNNNFVTTLSLFFSSDTRPRDSDTAQMWPPRETRTNQYGGHHHRSLHRLQDHYGDVQT